MSKDNEKEFLDLLKQLVALSYFQHGLPQSEIAKKIRVSTGKLNSYLKNIDNKKKRK